MVVHSLQVARYWNQCQGGVFSKGAQWRVPSPSRRHFPKKSSRCRRPGVLVSRGLAASSGGAGRWPPLSPPTLGPGPPASLLPGARLSRARRKGRVFQLQVRLGRCGWPHPGQEQPCARSPGLSEDLLGAVRAPVYPPTPWSGRRENGSSLISLGAAVSLFVQGFRWRPPGRTARPRSSRTEPPARGGPRPVSFPAGQGGSGRGAETPEPPGPGGKRRGPAVGSPQGRGQRIRVSARRPRLPRAAARAAAEPH